MSLPGCLTGTCDSTCPKVTLPASPQACPSSPGVIYLGRWHQHSTSCLSKTPGRHPGLVLLPHSLCPFIHRDLVILPLKCLQTFLFTLWSASWSSHHHPSCSTATAARLRSQHPRLLPLQSILFCNRGIFEKCKSLIIQWYLIRLAQDLESSGGAQRPTGPESPFLCSLPVTLGTQHVSTFFWSLPCTVFVPGPEHSRYCHPCLECPLHPAPHFQPPPGHSVSVTGAEILHP